METVHYEQVSPPPALSDAIECFWRLILPLVVAPDEIISAEGRAEILFQFHGQSQIMRDTSETPFNCASSWLMRPFAHALHVRQVGITSSAMIGVRFTPGGWAAFRHHDTTDKQPHAFMPLSDFYAPAEVHYLEEQLYHVLGTPQWAHPLISFFVHRRVEKIHLDRIVYASQQLVRQQISISALAYDVNLSERQFGRVFRQLIGLSPKQFSRVARLNRVLNSTDDTMYGLTLEQLAIKYGFHDPSHLVREFQELAGMSPVDFFSGDYDLIEQKFRENDPFLHRESDTISLLSNTLI